VSPPSYFSRWPVAALVTGAAALRPQSSDGLAEAHTVAAGAAEEGVSEAGGVTTVAPAAKPCKGMPAVAVLPWGGAGAGEWCTYVGGGEEDTVAAAVRSGDALSTSPAFCALLALGSCFDTVEAVEDGVLRGRDGSTRWPKARRGRPSGFRDGDVEGLRVHRGEGEEEKPVVVTRGMGMMDDGPKCTRRSSGAAGTADCCIFMFCARPLRRRCTSCSRVRTCASKFAVCGSGGGGGAVVLLLLLPLLPSSGRTSRLF
jgi:hypothetical protein